MKPKDKRVHPRMEPENLINFPGEENPATRVTGSIQEVWGPSPEEQDAVHQEKRSLEDLGYRRQQ
ncbi:hypothetical protein [Paludifilum halophilum]|uniref:Uncharacterized protein n=1 Tax=Paludifilum halophilum TaxID=1642702 RepID=A0A235BBD3_9BACL|nr:hypothetical protein [Paludifilum halophilum]OYD08875.1 hypothetical protein CHM34_03570 [Paludifilum halophilum]